MTANTYTTTDAFDTRPIVIRTGLHESNEKDFLSSIDRCFHETPQFNAYDPAPSGIGYVICSTVYVVAAKYKYINDFYFANNNKYVQLQFGSNG